MTALTRAVRRTATAVAATAMLTLLPVGCGADSEAGSRVDAGAAAAVDAQSALADAGLLDAILGSDAADEPDAGATTADPGPSGVEDSVTMADAGEPPVDAEQGADADEPADVPLVIADAGTPGPDAGPGPVDAGATPVDAGPIDLEPSCLQPIGQACDTTADCPTEPNGVICDAGECWEQDFVNEDAMACCQQMYANEIYDAKGCNPWGPPAPPEDRGYRLDELRAPSGIA